MRKKVIHNVSTFFSRRALTGIAAVFFIFFAVTLKAEYKVTEYPVPAGSHPHDVAPGPDGRVWYTAQHTGEAGWLDPATGKTHHISLGRGSRPHGVIIGPQGKVWITDSGLNAIVRIDPDSEKVIRYQLPENTGYANLNTATFDAKGALWFTGQSGVFGRLEPNTGQIKVHNAPRGRGPYGIDASIDGYVYYASLAGSYVGRVDPSSGGVSVLEPPTRGQGARRVWADSMGVIWITGWNSGDLIRYDPSSASWSEIPMPGINPSPYAVYVDERDQVWISDFSANAIVLYSPATDAFITFTLPSRNASVRQMLGRPGELWGAESGADKLVVIRY
ncbi:MAG: Vgb family protein [Planctomycetota bacterium]|jgi:virginiamycin B lyase